MNNNKKLSDKEEQVMNYFWTYGPLFVREIVDKWPEPKAHFNTISTFVRGLEAKGYLRHIKQGNSFQYAPTVDLVEYRRSSLGGIAQRLFGNSYLNMVSTLVKDEHLSVEELRELIDQIENQSLNDQK
jgi:predicted transcriptional regulator